MNGLTTTIYRKSSELPQLEDSNFFHSRRLMEISEHTPHQRPYMVVVSDSSNRIFKPPAGNPAYTADVASTLYPRPLPRAW